MKRKKYASDNEHQMPEVFGRARGAGGYTQADTGSVGFGFINSHSTEEKSHPINECRMKYFGGGDGGNWLAEGMIFHLQHTQHIFQEDIVSRKWNLIQNLISPIAICLPRPIIIHRQVAAEVEGGRGRYRQLSWGGQSIAAVASSIEIIEYLCSY